MERIRDNIKLVAFDLDGTIYNGNKLITGALEIIDFFKRKGKKICFFTNNSSLSRDQIFDKLLGFSIDLCVSDVYCCSYAIPFFLRKENYKSIFIIGSSTLSDEVSKSGINVTNEIADNNVDALLIGLDADFNYTKLARAYETLQRNKLCKIIVCNMDSNFPVENGLRKPGCGSIVSSILFASDRRIDFMIGKPDPFILDMIGKENNVLPKNILVIGDSFDSDIQMANNLNAHSILIDNIGIINSQRKITVSCLSEIDKIYNDYYI